MSKESKSGLYKIELNNMGDYIEISTADTGLFDRFVETYRQIVSAAKELPRRYREIEKVRVIPGHENKTVEKIRANVRFCEKRLKRLTSFLDREHLRNIFASTMRKYLILFREQNIS